MDLMATESSLGIWRTNTASALPLCEEEEAERWVSFLEREESLELGRLAGVLLREPDAEADWRVSTFLEEEEDDERWLLCSCWTSLASSFVFGSFARVLSVLLVRSVFFSSGTR